MLLEQFDVRKYERSLRAEGFEEGKREGFEEGHQEGIREGLAEGTQQERERSNKLIILLSEQNRMSDLIKAAHDKDYQDQLFQEFNLR